MNFNRYTASRRFLVCQTFLFVAFAAGLLGCGPNLATVSGTVTYKGEKVKGGMLIFAPVGEGAATPGDPAAAAVQEDGSFVLKTGGTDGALVGKATISYSAPGGEASTDPTKQGKASPYTGLTTKDKSVEIKPGVNTFNIELIAGK
jgi:hypothetical protein